MALAHCILGKFLGLVCHYFPPPLDVPTFAARCLYVSNNARDPSSERWNCGRQICPVILPKFRLPHKCRDLLHAANLRHGTDGFTSPPKEGVLRIVILYKISSFEITHLSITTHAQLQRHRLKFIKNHIKTPTCFGLRPSSGSYNVLAKITII
jgi:hypothetical protein